MTKRQWLLLISIFLLIANPAVGIGFIALVWCAFLIVVILATFTGFLND